MLPYEILIGFKGSMQTSARGFIGRHQLLRQLNLNVVNFYNFSTIVPKNKCDLRLVYKNINANAVKRFHTQLLANCQACPKDSKPIESHNISELSNDPFNDLIDSVEMRHKQNADKKNNKDNLKKVPEHVKQWLFSEAEKVPSKDIERRFPEPKAFLHNFFATVANETKIANCLTSKSKHVVIKNNKVAWSFTYEIKWPEKHSFTAVGHSKASASLSAALKTLHWLNVNNRINGRFPNVYDTSEKHSLLQAPEELKVEKKVLEKIDDFLHRYEKNIVDAVAKNTNNETEKFETDKSLPDRYHPISHIKVDIAKRNEILLDRYNNRTMISNPELPIFQYKDQILKELEDNQAIVIKGDTGCGKTTQVPQFILDHFSSQGKAADCCMIVTQPRRISAISLAQRIAAERGESVGDVVGYQVRLQQVLPRRHGAILFCTTGLLLKKLQTNLKLEGCSHIIVDEAHERSVDTDMLLVLLKRAMQINPHLKVVIMSATINADLFQEFLSCNAVEVPGRLYPVKMHFMEDILNLKLPLSNRIISNENEGPVIDTDQITDLIRWISENKPPGSILCFLPGWSNILKIQTNLEEYATSKLLVIPLHSKIPYAVQSKIFEPPPEGVRKIILATDIAETGITVPDVVYVVDSACHKQVRWHESKGLSSIDTHWISKANINQRKGRAGRVQKGESYHFITKAQYNNLEEYPTPEVLRVSLEKTVLDCKTYSNETAEKFLGSMPQPPRLSAVKIAVKDLQILGALNENQDLTPLGKRIALFTIHPKLSKAMVYSAIFQCLSPVTTVSSALSLDSEIFYGVLNNKSRIRFMKKRFHPTSDHLSLAWIYNQWLDFYKNGYQYAYDFCRKNNLYGERMNILHKVRDINLDHLKESGMIVNIREASDLNSEENTFSVLDELVRGVLLAGMDQILKHRNFEIRKGRLTKSGSSMVTEDDAKAQLTPECVNYKRTLWPSPFLIYYQKTHHHERRMTLIRESSIISPMTVLLFSQGRVTGSVYNDENTGEEKVLLKIDGKNNVNLVCDEYTAETILRFRDIMWSLVRYYVEKNVNRKSLFYADELTNSDGLEVFKKEMLKVLASVLSSAANSIDDVDLSGSDYSITNRTDDDDSDR